MSDDRELGLDRSITRRDFINSIAVGTGAALLGPIAPAADIAGMGAAAFNGYAGVGDYVHANGNTWDVVQAAHAMRDGAYRSSAAATDTGELFDVIVVGGGFAGIGAAHRVMQLTSGRKTCLVLENHALWGGEAKRNEFLVNGVRLQAPQGSNEAGWIPEASDQSEWAKLWREVDLPMETRYSSLPASRKALVASRSNYTFQLWGDNFANHGYFLPDAKRWVTNPWGNDLAGVPWSDDVKRDMLRWRRDPKRYVDKTGDALDRWLDSMTYEQYLTQVMGLGREPARYADPVLAASAGLGSDVISAYMAYSLTMPGFQALQEGHPAKDNYKLATNENNERFPGGNDAVMRAFVKRLIPDAIAGSTSFVDLHNGGIRLDKLDRPGQHTRIRLRSTVTAIEHEGALDKTERVAVTYVRDGRMYKAHARSVVVASGSWPAKHIVRDLPNEYRDAMGKFYRSPILVANVALTNWRALYKLGYTAASWRGGFGFSFNLSPPMQVGGYAPPFDPDSPVVITYYVPFCKVGLPVEAQGPLARTEMLATPYRDYERVIRAQLTDMLSAQGFDARTDIAGIILNRWGHAYVNPYPGFYFGRDGKPAPSDVVRKPLGRIAFAHSELRGHQNWNGAVEEAHRAVEQLLARG